MQVQNKVSQATPRLPNDVVQQGVVVSKSNQGFLLVVALTSDDPSFGRDQFARVPGVGNTQLFGGEYAMHVWLNPDKLHAYGLSSSDVLSAVRGQNVQFSAGQ